MVAALPVAIVRSDSDSFLHLVRIDVHHHRVHLDDHLVGGVGDHLGDGRGESIVAEAAEAELTEEDVRSIPRPLGVRQCLDELRLEADSISS